MAAAIHFHVKRGDTVQVISGNHKGATGKILQIRAKKQQVIIEGVRMIKKHTRRSQDSPQGGIIEREGPIHISNVKVSQPAESAKGKATSKAAPKTAPKTEPKTEPKPAKPKAPAKAEKAETAAKPAKPAKAEKADKPKAKKKAE